MLGEEEISREEIYSGVVFDAFKLKVRTEDNSIAEREIVEHNGGAAIIALNSDNEIYLVKQYRTAAAKIMYEIPAGKLEKGEDAKTCAFRELEEEVGLKASSLDFIYAFYPTPGYSSEIIYIYYADDFTKTKQHLDKDEFIEVETVSLDKAVEMIKNGEIIDGKTVVAILLLYNKLNEGK